MSSFVSHLVGGKDLSVTFVQKAIEPLDITVNRAPGQTQLIRLMHFSR